MCSRPEHVEAARFSRADLTVFLDAVVDWVEPVDVWFLRRPQLRDPSDELVLEAVVNGRADAIATFDRRDFRPAVDRIGILLPAEAIRGFHDDPHLDLPTPPARLDQGRGGEASRSRWYRP